LKLLVTGPPAAGKSHFARLIALQYGLPLVEVGELVDRGYQLQNKLGEKMRGKAEEIKDQIVADYNKTKKKKDPELDRASVKVKLPDKYIVKLVREELKLPACRNKGFVLDCFPKTYEQAVALFSKKTKTDG